MAGCCSGTSGCRCVVSAETDDGCNPVGITVTGGGSQATPFVIGSTFDFTRLLRLNGDEPWTLETIGGCTVIVPRCRYSMQQFQFMCTAGGVLVGYSWVSIDCVTNAASDHYQALDTTTVTTSLPAGWSTCCTTSVGAEFLPMFTDGADLTTLVGYVFISYNANTGVFTQQYLTLAGSVTSTKPVGWVQGDCGAEAAPTTGDATATLTTADVMIAVKIVAASSADITWTNMPAAEDFFNGSSRNVLRFDCTKFSQARLVVRKLGTAGASGSKLIAQYSTVNPGTSFVGADWSDLGTSEISCAVNTTNTEITSSWVNLASGAKSDVYLTIIGSGGDGAIDPVFGDVFIEFRMLVVTDVVVTGGGGGGGSGTPVGSIHLYLSSGTVLNNVKYPDWGQPGLVDADRVDVLSMPPTFTTGAWKRIVLTLFNVQAALTADVTVILKNITTASTVATITLVSGTSPTNDRVHLAAAIASGSWADGDAIQWHLSSAQDDNAFGLHAEAFYELS